MARGEDKTNYRRYMIGKTKKMDKSSEYFLCITSTFVSVSACKLFLNITSFPENLSLFNSHPIATL